MDARDVAWVASRAVAKHGGFVAKILYRLADTYRKAYKNLNYDMHSNGEYFLLDQLTRLGDVKIVFDVGANKGNYAKACLVRFNGAKVHAFELLPSTYAKLEANVRSPFAVLNNFGLSDSDGVLAVNYSPDNDQIASLVDVEAIHSGEWHTVPVTVSTGDAYCEKMGIDKIDLLKIDVEGAEGQVLQGFNRMFAEQAISTVQFEFGMANIYSKFLLKDFWEFFEIRGFVVGPIMPNGVEFKKYHPGDEDFQGPPNFFAVHSSRTRIIDAVKR